MGTIEQALADQLKQILERDVNRFELVRKFCQTVQDLPPVETEEPLWEIFGDLAYDFHFYEPDPRLREEDPSYYDDEHLEGEIRTALQRLKQMGCE